MSDPNARRLLWYLFAGSKGGDNRIRIIELLKERPYNINQLAEALRLDYKAIQHHIVALEKNNLVNKMGEKYGILYFISNYLEANIESFNEIRSKIKKWSHARFTCLLKYFSVNIKYNSIILIIFVISLKASQFIHNHGISAREISLLQDLCSNIIGLCPFMLIFLDARLVR